MKRASSRSLCSPQAARRAPDPAGPAPASTPFNCDGHKGLYQAYDVARTVRDGSIEEEGHTTVVCRDGTTYVESNQPRY